ncbi:DNA-binding response regulator [Dokdonia pacifica]|uniref:Two component transcriptional regulator, LuxR family n=1 Tax=Dokdonia pacifica TaxID=1627892 RepID=A0A239A9H0_9FLAO|nr:response regulator transcription factor [Dokdonia pacifica]GGG35713.1 DNA-binding response regulator [Dokdonia pacifica]SNR92277.1 two component transcriptional regulator, LuxR family [Dokdonia pacifica]
MKKTTIIIADDHPLLLSGTENFLKSKDYNILDTATDGNTAYNTISNLQPEIAILDFDMPKLNGLEIAKLCVQHHVDTKIIILTLHKEEAIIKQLGKTIQGYILKDDTLQEIETCIIEVCKGNIYKSKKLQEEIYLPNNSSEIIKKLTPTELKILRYLAKDWSSSQIADHLFISKRTVEKHRSNIIHKLEIKSSQNALLLWVQKHPSLFS